MRRWLALIAMACIAQAVAHADDATTWRDRLTLTASLRVRGEFVDWFDPPAAAAPHGVQRYAFFASQLRVGARLLFPHVELGVEVQDTRLTGLPDDATLASPPFGALGPGALYFLHTHDTTQGEPFLKQGFVTLRRAGVSATLGRFQYRDGLETVPADATLATLKRTRIAERLVGPFEFTHVTRSFDGAQLAYDAPAWNATALAVRPTHGGFEVSANRQIEDVGLAGLALTLKRLPAGPPLDARLFYLFYGDRRVGLPKVDNTHNPRFGFRDTGALDIHTVGAHMLTAFDAGPGILDLLAWAVGQTGDWGSRRHVAWASALEAGYQLPRLPAAPWLRAGIDRSSGDDDPFDDRHETFFQLLPTPRIYAQFPFFNAMNLEDLFASLVLRPHQKVTVRTDYHWLRVTERPDLWYSGGGAQNDDLFGYAGTPTKGRRELGHLVDLSITLALTRQVALAGYYGHAFGGDVVTGTFDGRDADYGFVEMTLRY
jgi:hypothetical protein